MCDWNEAWYVNYRHLVFLFSGFGSDYVYGLIPDNLLGIRSEYEQKENIYRVMVELYQLGYIEWEDGKIKMNEPIHTCISIIRNSDIYIEYRSSQSAGILYQGTDHLLRMSPSTNDKNGVMMQLQRKREFYQFIEMDSVLSTSLFSEHMQEMKGEQDTIMSFCVRCTHSGKTIREVSVVLSGIYTYLHISEDEKIRIEELNENSIDVLLFGGR